MPSVYEESASAQLRASVHQLKLKFRNSPRITRALAILCVVAACIIVYKLFVYVFITDISYHTDWKQCPACYGTRMCRRIHQTNVHGKEKFHHINYMTNVKNVYFGKLNHDEYVFKKLAHDTELSAVDEYVCQGGFSRCRTITTDNNKFCVKADAKGKEKSCDLNVAKRKLAGRLTGPLRLEEVWGLSDAMQCPSPRLVQRIVHRYQERGEFVNEFGLSKEEKLMLLYTLAVNAEPIVLQLFPRGEGWPFPAYIGACGRMIAEEYAGVPLRTFFHSDWTTRVKLSLRVLRIADQLTDNASGFRLYFSDISLDNYVVNESDLSVRISDAENILIVDAQHLSEAKPPGYQITHNSTYDKCDEGKNCLSVDVIGLCKSQQADFNYYAVCRSLLSSYSQDEEGMSGGLLHSLPDSLPQADTITSLANQCAKPLRHQDRFAIKEQLMATLEDVVKIYNTT